MMKITIFVKLPILQQFCLFFIKSVFLLFHTRKICHFRTKKWNTKSLILQVENLYLCQFISKGLIFYKQQQKKTFWSQKVTISDCMIKKSWLLGKKSFAKLEILQQNLFLFVIFQKEQWKRIIFIQKSQFYVKIVITISISQQNWLTYKIQFLKNLQIYIIYK